MDRKLLVDLRELTAAQREAIGAAARARGFEVRFRNEGDALEDAEVYFGADPAILDAAPGLRWMCASFAGVDHLTAPAAARGDVLLSNSSGAYGVTIAEHVVMLALELMRRQMEYMEIVRRREWVRGLAVRSIWGSRITVLGTGDLGREIAKRLRAFGPETIVGVNRRGSAEPGIFDAVRTVAELDGLLPETDLLVMTLPGTRETVGLMSQARLSLLPSDAFLINVGRGSTVDQAALLRQLRDGRLGGAALDVFEREPLPGDDPAWECPRLLITPHVAGNMTLPYTVERIVALFLEDFVRYCDGKPLLRQIDLRQGY